MNYRRRDMAGTTEFFREAPLVWAADTLLPAAAKRLGRKMLVGEVGCSTGEETWSIAAQLMFRQTNFHIDAIDYQRGNLASSERGGPYQYAYRTMMKNVQKNGVPDGCLDYFPGIRTNTWRDPVVIDPVLRPRASFINHNVLHKPLTRRKYDAITAFNLLYYYNLEGQCLMLGNMLAGLKPGGYFMCDATPGYDPEWLPLTKEFSLKQVDSRQWPSTIFQLES